MKKPMMFAATFAAVATMQAAVTITDITARQRWPWNGLVDIDFTIAGAQSGDAFAIDIDAVSGSTTLSAKTYITEPVAGLGDNRIVWDLGKDYPEFRTKDLRISVTATTVSGSTPVYCVVDLSGGASATKYPVRYTTKHPEHVRGAANEPCQTSELWLRRIRVPDSAFTVNSYAVSDASMRNYWGKMTKDYYIGVFELTQKQYQLVMGDWPKSWFTNEACRASRPLEGLRYDSIVGSLANVQLDPAAIATSSFLGKLREKSGLALTLPSNIQLNFAARGGTRLNGGADFHVYAVDGTIPSDKNSLLRSKDNMQYPDAATDKTGNFRNVDAASGTAYVGSYSPNDYGLYDTLGNVREFTSEFTIADGNTYRKYYQTFFENETIGNTKENPVIDPLGVSAESAKKSGSASLVYRVVRGGHFASASTAVDLWTMDSVDSSYSDEHANLRVNGFRLSMTVE